MNEVESHYDFLSIEDALSRAAMRIPKEASEDLNPQELLLVFSFQFAALLPEPVCDLLRLLADLLRFSVDLIH